jgi:hypothetical protein
VRKLLAAYLENTEAAVIAGALAIIMRDLFDVYDPVTRVALMEGLMAFVQHRDIDKERRAEQLRRLGFTLPKGVM